MWGCVWAEDEAWNLDKEAQTKGYHISWAEVRLASPLDPTDPPQSVFIPGQLTLEQEDLNAEEFSVFIPFEDLSDTGRG